MRITHTIGVFTKGPDTGSGGGAAPQTTKGANNFYIETLLAIPPSFKAAKPGEGKPFENGELKGTRQFNLAEVVLGFGKTGGNITGVRVVRRVYPEGHAKAGKTDFLCAWPTRSIGPVRHAILDVSESAEANQMLFECGQKIVGYWMAWQKERTKAGVKNSTAASGSNVALTASDDMLKELGLSE